jgi:hypothetical protein
MASRPDATARESLRIAQVYHTVLRYMLDMVVDHGPLAGVRRRFQFWLHDVPQEPVALDTAAKTRLLLQELGPTYVKVGQLVSSQSQVLPDDWERELARLQQNVAPFPYEQVHRIVVAELGAPPEDLYEHFDEVPLAAASLGQVHRARVGGEEVVVKVQRPGAARQIRADLGIMRNLTRFLERQAQWAREVGLAEVVDEFGKNVIAELDYYGEAYNARKLADNMLDIPGVRVPSDPLQALLGAGADDAVRRRRDDYRRRAVPRRRTRSRSAVAAVSRGGCQAAADRWVLPRRPTPWQRPRRHRVFDGVHDRSGHVRAAHAAATFHAHPASRRRPPAGRRGDGTGDERPEHTVPPR